MDRNLTVLPPVGAASSPADPACQLRTMPGAVADLSRAERARDALAKAVRRAARRTVKVARDPMIVWRKVAARVAPRGLHAASSPQAQASPQAPAPHALGLRPGESVRVRGLAEIEAMLDGEGRTAGLAFLPVVMARYCGRTLTVRQRVDRFFDERNWRMMKLRDVVILDGSFCEPARDAGVPWAGCQRACFLFWKEAWLERVGVPD